MGKPTDVIKVKTPTKRYHTEPCFKAECFGDDEYIGKHYHSTTPGDTDFIMKVDGKGNYI